MKVAVRVKSTKPRKAKTNPGTAKSPQAQTSTAPAQKFKLQIEQAPVLQRIPWLVHGFSTREGGVTSCYGAPSLNLGFTQHDAREHVVENRRRLLRAVGAVTRGQAWPLIVNRQIHSDVIHVVRSIPTDGEPLAGDGVVTALAGIGLAILTADCLPVLLADRKKKVVAAFHAGWRGTVQRIAEKGLGIMRREFGSRPQDISAAIGPGIQSCCYEVGEELKEQFESQFSYSRELFREVQSSDPVREKYPLLFMNQRAPGHGDLCIKLHLDLREANRRQLIEAGIPAMQIFASANCTACNTKNFFSHRAEKGHTGRMMAVIGIAKQ